MAMNGIGECKLCFEKFSETIRSRCLPCGHSFCTSCLDNLVKKRSITCPICKLIHTGATATEFPINYDLEDTILRCREVNLADANETPPLDSSCLSNNVFQNQDVRINPRVQEVISDQTFSSENLLQESINLKSEVKEYQDFLDVEKAKHLELRQKIKNLADVNEATVKLFGEEQTRLTNMTSDADDLIRKMKERLQSLKIAGSLKSAINAISDLDTPFSELEKWKMNCRQNVPDAKVITTSKKVITEATAALSLVDYKIDLPIEVPEFSHNNLTILEKKDRILGYSARTLNMERLKNLAQTRRGLLEKGLVYAVQSEAGVIRNAQISTDNDKVYLHHLQYGEPPENVYTIKQSELVSSLNEESARAFLDLAWKGSTTRLLIRLSHGTPHGHQFRALCTGDLGPSYAHSKFDYIEYEGTEDERVRGGNYDGKGGSAIMSGLEVNLPVYKRAHVPGSVWVYYPLTDRRRSAQFAITTGKGDPKRKYDCVFGQVIEGLDVVREAAKVGGIKNVEIIDCGVVIPL